MHGLRLFRCYGRALKLMAEAPSLWYDLGLNYHRQARLLCSTQGEEEDPSSLSLLLEKAQQVVGVPGGKERVSLEGWREGREVRLAMLTV